MIVRLLLMLCIIFCGNVRENVLSTASEVICFATEFEARMGNLMFEYAATVGLCAKHNRTVSECSQLIMPRFNDPDTPVPEFVQTFKIPTHKIEGCTIDKKYVEHAEAKESIMYDDKLLEAPSGTMLYGYLQSYKYFHPHAERQIKELYRFSPDIHNQSATFIHSIRKQLPHPWSSNGTNNGNGTTDSHEHLLHHHHTVFHPWMIVGVHVRLGDKLNNPFYNSWSLSVAYYQKAIELVRAQHNHTAFVFFTGGSTNKAQMAKDEEWTREHLAGNITHSFHERSNNHLVALHSLSLCDVIITAHSTYSWWAAYLSHSRHVIAPRQIYPHRLPLFVPEDYYLPHWQLVSEDPAEDRIFGVNPFRTSNGSSVSGSAASRHLREHTIVDYW